MIQVLERAFRILEWLATAESSPRALSELAAHIHVSPAACLHIVKTMMDYGYVVQVAPRKGYRLGPMAAMLGRHHNPHAFLIELGRPVVERVAEETGETTLIACLHRTRRLILCQAEGRQTIRVSSDAIVLEDLFGTATGRALLAFLPASRLDEILAESRPAGTAWDVADTADGVRAALAATRAAGFALNPNHEAMAQVAYPIYAGTEVTAAIGCFAPVYRFDRSHKEHLLAVLGSAAAELSAKLSGTQQKGLTA